jgi:hypothetical protein
MSTLVLPLRQLCVQASLMSKLRLVDPSGVIAILTYNAHLFITSLIGRAAAKLEKEGQANPLVGDVDLRPAVKSLREGDRSVIVALLADNGYPECPICLVHMLYIDLLHEYILILHTYRK